MPVNFGELPVVFTNRGTAQTPGPVRVVSIERAVSFFVANIDTRFGLGAHRVF
jgi:hypothetical protein